MSALNFLCTAALETNESGFKTGLVVAGLKALAKHPENQRDFCLVPEAVRVPRLSIVASYVDTSPSLKFCPPYHWTRGQVHLKAGFNRCPASTFR